MKNKILFHAIIIIIIAIPVAFLFYGWASLNYESQPDYKYTEVTRTEPRVYVTNTGDSYHSGSCGALYNSKIPMGRGQASEEGYLPCQRCGGASSGTITVTYTVKEKAPMGTKHIVLSILLSALSTPLCYLFVYVGITSWKEDAWIRESMKKKHNPSTVSPINKPQVEPPKPLTERERLMKYYTNLTDDQVDLYVGRTVLHKQFGKGYITRIIDRKYIEVYFDELHEFKKFVYPDAFVDKHLEV